MERITADPERVKALREMGHTPTMARRVALTEALSEEIEVLDARVRSRDVRLVLPVLRTLVDEMGRY